MKSQTWVKTPLWLTIALLICCLVSAWLAVHGFYFSLFVALCLTAFVAYTIYRYILRSARAMAQFIWAVRYSEFLSSPTSNLNATQPLPEELLTEMQDALEHYRNNLQKKESKLQYFQALANHIDMAILVYTPDGQMEWVNDAAKRLIHIDCPHTINDLVDFHPDLPAKLHTLKAGDLSVWQIKQEEETVQFALSGMEFVIQGRKLLIAGMKNIHSALDNRETEAWQKLIRVLTHEIMNSVTPITSLSDTLLTLIQGSEELKAKSESISSDKETADEIRNGLHTISTTGKGLLSFVENYLRFTRIPKPEPSLFYVKGFINRMVELARHQYPDSHITFHSHITPDDLILYADENLISQVLINLLKNAIQAIEAAEIPEGIITLHAYCNENEAVLIEVSNNGPAILSEVAEHIFIPFFTTKEGSSGIGLSISRQIMRLSGGSLSLHPGKETMFVLKFN